MRNLKKTAPFLSGLLALELARAAAGLAATLNVTKLADDGTAGTLRSQIAAAASGDTIAFTVSGTITLALGELVVGKDLTIHAAGITLQGTGSSRVLRLTAGNTLALSGSAAQRVQIAGGVAATGGGVQSAGTLTIHYARLHDNSATTGGGLFSEDAAGPTTLTDVIVEDNSARDGAGIANGSFAGGGGALSLTDCVVEGNLASGGGPFAGNEGGGILNFGTLELVTSVVRGNTAGVGAGIYSATAASGLTLTLDESEVSGNVAKVAGGLFLLGTAEITNGSEVSGNTATGGAPFHTGDGGGILNYGDMTIEGSEVSGNLAQKGGGVYNMADLHLTDATIAGNSATDGFQTITANRGGGILSAGSLVVDGATSIESNAAGLGGGIFIQSLSATADLVEAVITGNAAVAGAGIANGDSQAGGGTVVLEDCELTDNEAIGGTSGSSDENPGGAIFNFGTLTVTGGEVSRNRAGSGAAILNERSIGRACDAGGSSCSVNADCTSGACGDRGDVILEDVTIEENRAGLGGAIVNRSDMGISGSVIAANRADYGGGIYNDGQGLLAIVNSTLSDNLAGTSVVDGDVVVDPGGGANVFNNSATLDALNVTIQGGSIVVRGGLFFVGNSILDDSPCSMDTVLLSKGYNLESDDSCGLTGTGDAVDAVAGLDPLADNGGPTRTHGLGSSSEAINTGHPAAPGSAGACAEDDQRGNLRTAASTGRCDKGAYESACGNSIVDAAEDCDDGNVANGDGCDHNCTTTACGNGIVTAGEACDDGNLDDDDYCAGLRCVAGANIGSTCNADSQCDKAAVEGDCVGIVCTVGQVGQLCTVDDDCDAPAVAGVCDGCGSITHSCGDGSVQASEEACDDGNDDNSDGCLDNCMEAACGDGYVEEGVENCDDANLQTGDGCTSACTLEYCGDAVVNNGDEACDDGNVDNNDGCRNDCQLSSCGDGVPDFGEDCDDDNNQGGDGCSPTCGIEDCGNSILDAGEACDDGNLTDDDGCDSNCTETGCGNGVVTTGEVCDDGNETGGDYCNADCSAATGSCGDSTIQPNAEGCDDGPDRRNGDGCDALCQLESCGDGLVNDGAPLGTGEACDDGNNVSGDYCSSDCTAATGSCGDGDVQSNEECDDGNLAAGDGCDATCDAEFCGDRVVNDVAEICDDGNNLSHDYCAADCTAASGTCGDGTVQSRLEDCDDGRQCSDLTTDCTVAGAIACTGILDGLCLPRSGDGCDSNCRNTGCGNGVVTGDEQCDDGNADSRDYCSPECESTGSCGDSLVQSGVEHCDAGGVQTRTCEADCHRAVCGDGVLNSLAGEACDDGRQCTDGTPCTGDASVCSGIGDGTCRTRANDYCSPDCSIATGFCDDGIIQKAVEECDDENVQSASCERNCNRPRCGDTFVNAFVGEACDDGDVDSTNACTGACQPATCGDGFVWSGVEACDDSGESIACDDDCTLSECGDGGLNVTSGESCDDGNVVDNDGCSSTCGGEGLQSEEQQECIVGMNDAGLRLARAQAREDFDCVKKGLRGVFDTINAQVCLARDERGRLADATADVLEADARYCGTRPGFGYSDADTAIAAAKGQNIQFVADLFGANLNEAIITKQSSVDGHRCQTALMKSANLLLLSRIRAFNDCKKRALRDEVLDSAADLATVCFAEVAADARTLSAKLKKLTATRTSRCAGVTLSEAAPGSCAGLDGAAFDACVDRHAACRMCLMLNEADRLSQPCDLYDDSVVNGSCQ